MLRIQQGYTNNASKTYDNIRNVNFQKFEDLMENVGTLKGETLYSNDPFNTESFKVENGIYIYQTHYDPKRALRIYKDYADYQFAFHDDYKLVSELQARQKDVKLTDFPTGVVTVQDKVIGQEIPYYEDYVPLAKIYHEKKDKQCRLLLITFYLRVLEILKELTKVGIIYSDAHAYNFLYDMKNDIMKLIDFDSSYLAFEDSPITHKKEIYQNMIGCLKRTLKLINQAVNLNLEQQFDTMATLEDIEDDLLEKHYDLSK